MLLSFYKKIDTLPNSIFYSLYKKNDSIIGVARQHYGAQRSLFFELNNDFEIINEFEPEFHGEDPRLFSFAPADMATTEESEKELYMTDNCMHEMHLYNFATKNAKRLKLWGKNCPFFSFRGQKYALHTFTPFAIHSVDLETGICKEYYRIEPDSGNPDAVELQRNSRFYRGGTPAYHLSVNENEFFGFGHTSYYEGSTMKHDPFLWKLHFDENKENISYKIIDIEKPPNAKNICDPTSILFMGDAQDWYLVTAESDNEWVHDQDYTTNMYKINMEYLTSLL